MQGIIVRNIVKLHVFQVQIVRKMKSNVKDEKNEFQASVEFGESSEDTSGCFESSSTLNNEKLYKASTPEQFTDANSRLRSRMKMQQVCTSNLLSSDSLT